MKAILYRTGESDEGTYGVIVFDGQYLHTGELPWKDNKPNVSCIPPGTHKVSVRVSPKYGKCYVVKVGGRTYILFHQGNFFGDKSLGYRSNTNGCILLGFKRGRLYNQKAVLASRLARTRFETVTGWELTELEVISLWNG